MNGSISMMERIKMLFPGHRRLRSLEHRIDALQAELLAALERAELFAGVDQGAGKLKHLSRPAKLFLGDANLADIRENPPVELAFHVDQGGYGRTATFEKGAELDRAVELLCAIKIGAETGEWVTDNYNWIRLTWEDGTETYISLNLHSLEYVAHSSPHMYALEHLDAFWSFAAGYLEED